MDLNKITNVDELLKTADNHEEAEKIEEIILQVCKKLGTDDISELIEIMRGLKDDDPEDYGKEQYLKELALNIHKLVISKVEDGMEE